MNKLILGDNLEIMRKMDSETIDLIYLDPPFFSNRNYEVIWGDKGEIRSFEDRWSGGVDHYIAWLKERVAEMHRILKSSGSIYLHCDWHADAYIRVYILDKIFGEKNFRNHIIWQRTRNPKGSQFEKKNLGIATDSIYWYSKSHKYYFNEESAREQLQDGDLARKYPYFDDSGRYYQGPIIRGASMGTRPNLVYEYKGYTPKEWGWRMTKDKLIELDEKGDLGWSSSGKPFRKLRPDKDKGNPIYNLWNDINRIYATTNEAIGYPTQKPEKLLERIIFLCSREGDIVFDPFLGGGTAVVVADRLNRQWLGIDQSVQAIKVSEIRLNKQQNLFSADFSVQLHKYDYDTLRHKDAFEFETWIIERFDGIANIKQRGDFGIDGRMRNGTPIQVKRSENIGRSVVDNFISSCRRYDKNLFAKNKANAEPVGFIIAFSFGKGAIQEVARLQNEENIIIKLVEVETIVPIAKKPKLAVELKQISKDAKGMTEIEFTAIAESEAGIEFFAWDFEYQPPLSPLLSKEGKESERSEESGKVVRPLLSKEGKESERSEESGKIVSPLLSKEGKESERSEESGEVAGGFKADVMLDREGRQTHKFKPGAHKIAVKAIDNEGLEVVEVVKVKVNGDLEVGK